VRQLRGKSISDLPVGLLVNWFYIQSYIIQPTVLIAVCMNYEVLHHVRPECFVFPIFAT
jgi:hypothetical protein